MAGAEPQLEVHVNAGLNVGLSERKVVEAIVQSFPPPVSHASVCHLVAKLVFEERGLSPVTVLR